MYEYKHMYIAPRRVTTGRDAIYQSDVYRPRHRRRMRRVTSGCTARTWNDGMRGVNPIDLSICPSRFKG